MSEFKHSLDKMLGNGGKMNPCHVEVSTNGEARLDKLVMPQPNLSRVEYMKSLSWDKYMDYLQKQNPIFQYRQRMLERQQQESRVSELVAA